MKRLFSLLSLAICLIAGSNQVSAQCFQIESILVDACGAQEGLNEMVRFRVGNAPLNTSNMSVDWPNNNWQGLVQNATTAGKVAALNADIQAAGGCGQLLEPTNGVLPANAVVILVTSHMMDTALNQFGALTDTMYIIFQNNPDTVSGHFANFGSGIRTLEISFGSCWDEVSYNRALLVNPDGATTAADGATVNFTPDGTATYVNFGCSAPVPPFSVTIETSPISACAGTTVSLTGTAVGHQSVVWTASVGTFSNPTSLTTNYTIPAGSTTPITVTLTATNVCNATISETLVITPTAAQTPSFSLATTFCSGATVPTLPATSSNGIAGTWNPATISNTASGTYTFTPNAGQCASAVTLDVTITNQITPIFLLEATVCQGSTPIVLPTTSQNGITGTWSPATISSTTSGNYVFTPSAGQCASPYTHAVTVAPSIIPQFSFATTFCAGSTVPTLPTTSDNGIPGTWTPAVIDNTTSATYEFVPQINTCASNVQVTVTITNAIAPTFTLATTYCAGQEVEVLPATSDNGIAGIWSPSAINNAQSGSYVFTPADETCASSYTLNVTITDPVVPVFFEIPTTICSGAEPIVLDTTSTNGITGMWAPATVTGAGTYVFTPDVDCAQEVSIEIQDAQPDFTIAQYCNGTTAVLEVSGDADDATWSYNGAAIASGLTFDVSTWIKNQTGLTLPVDFSVEVNAGECSFTESVSVTAVWCGIPKGVSANGDMANDTFNLSGMGVRELRIFNRYGLEVYSKSDYTSQWAGQSNDGNDLPDATYYYVISTYSGEVKTGWVYLLRKV
jgi:gliding motility-associated-like protein